MKKILTPALALLLLMVVVSCNNNHKSDKKRSAKHIVFKGLYNFGPEVHMFKECASGQEFWAVDSSAKLELGYSQMQFEKPYEPVYVEVEGQKIKSGKDGQGAEFDSTLVVKKLIKITRDIPKGCN